MQVKDISDEQCKSAAWWAKNTPLVVDKCTLDFLVKFTGAPMKVCIRKMESMIAKGKMDCGVSVRTAWWIDY